MLVARAESYVTALTAIGNKKTAKAVREKKVKCFIDASYLNTKAALSGGSGMAEREGFEPSLGFWPTRRLAISPLQPLGYLSVRSWLKSAATLPIYGVFRKEAVMLDKSVKVTYFWCARSRRGG